MGCSGSRLGHGHGGMGLPPRLRPLFLLRLEEFRIRRRHIRPIKDSSSTTSKLLLHERDDDDENSSDSVGRKLYEEKPEGEEHGKPKLGEVCEKIKDVKMKEESEFEDALTVAYSNDDDEDDDKEDEDGRMIGYGPASPSFRVFFMDVGEQIKHNDLGEVKINNAFKRTIPGDDDDDNEVVSYKECIDENKKVKKGRKRKSFKKVLPKGGQTAVKNLLSINLCYTSPSPSPHHHHCRRHNHILTGKTMA